MAKVQFKGQWKELSQKKKKKKKSAEQSEPVDGPMIAYYKS